MIKTLKSFNEIAELIGEEHALKLVEVYGGARLYISEQYSEKLEVALGKQTYEIVRYCFMSEIIEIPICKREKLDCRNRLFYKERLTGKSNNEIALEYHVSWRTVINAINKYLKTNTKVECNE